MLCKVILQAVVQEDTLMFLIWTRSLAALGVFSVEVPVSYCYPSKSTKTNFSKLMLLSLMHTIQLFFSFFLLESQSVSLVLLYKLFHRIIECQVGRDLKDHVV